MSVIEVGRVCLKTKGKDAGKKVVIVNFEKDFAIVDGPRVKRKKCNMQHLLPLKEKLEIKKDATKDEVKRLLK